VVVAVRACGVNRLDVLQRSGPGIIRGFSLPHVPGMDIAGEVVTVGASVDGVRPGDRVLVKSGVHCGVCVACVRGDDHRCAASRLLGGNVPGGYAERCAVPASHVFPIPAGVGFGEAATLPTALSTAWRGVVVTGRLRIGEQVVIHGAGSGVSVLAIQIAKRAGARVIVTSRSDERLRQAIALGADVGINTATTELAPAVVEATGGGADMVFDHVGPALFPQSLQALRPGGRLVFCGTTTGAQATFLLPQAYHNGLSLLGVPNQRYREFGEMLAYYWQGGFRPVIDEELPLTEAVAAHRRMESGDVFGKIVLTP
jgi:NADPH:quinone reductase-like Zn-dependent oxidoreductase